MIEWTSGAMLAPDLADYYFRAPTLSHYVPPVVC